jgi:hypothetical protein
MSKFEWMELETLSNEIAHSQSRLDAARATKNHGLVSLLQQEIAEATERRARVLADITKGVGRAPVQRVRPEGNEEKQQPAERVEASITTGVVAPELTPIPYTIEGVATVWDKLTRADVERVKHGLTSRRSELLARHAEELKALDAEQTEIDVIEQAIGAFATKFKIGGGAEVVPFNAEHNAHSQVG